MARAGRPSPSERHSGRGSGRVRKHRQKKLSRIAASVYRAATGGLDGAGSTCGEARRGDEMRRVRAGGRGGRGPRRSLGVLEGGHLDTGTTRTPPHTALAFENRLKREMMGSGRRQGLDRDQQIPGAPQPPWARSWVAGDRHSQPRTALALQAGALDDSRQRAAGCALGMRPPLPTAHIVGGGWGAGWAAGWAHCECESARHAFPWTRYRCGRRSGQGAGAGAWSLARQLTASLGWQVLASCVA